MKLLEKFLKEQLNIASDKVMESFDIYNSLLMEWNSKINLVSRKNTDIENNVLNSIYFLTKYPLKGSENIIDIGTGGGFPAIPLKIIYPDIKITLNDSINKKVKVLEEIIRKMNFNNSRAVWARAEDICNDKKYNHKFDIAISKAVTELDKLYLWSREFLKQGGNMLSIKGGDTQKEEKEFHKKFPGKKLTEIKYEFDSGYNIIDKKLIVIN